MLAVAFYAIPGLSGSIAIQEAAINRTIIEDHGGTVTSVETISES